MFNLIRKAFGIKSKLQFSEINSIGFKEGTRLRRYLAADTDTRYYLLIESQNDSDVIICQFKNEKDASNIASVLKKFILNKEGILV